MQPTITTKPAFKVIGIQYRGDDQIKMQCRNLWDELSNRFDVIRPLAVQPFTSYGIHTNIDMKNNVCDHTAAIEVHQFGKMPEDMVSLQIPEQKYAVFQQRFSKIKEEVMSYKDWWMKSGNKRSGGPELFQFEQPYEIGFNPIVTDAMVSIYIPITK